MVAEAAAGPAQNEEARQASLQELQTLKDSLNHAEAKTRDLEGQLENLNKVNIRHCLFLLYEVYIFCYRLSQNMCQ